MPKRNIEKGDKRKGVRRRFKARSDFEEACIIHQKHIYLYIAPKYTCTDEPIDMGKKRKVSGYIEREYIDIKQHLIVPMAFEWR